MKSAASKAVINLREVVVTMNWKFWKKDELALPDYSSAFGKSDLGLSSNTGLDLSDHYSPTAGAAPMSSLPPPSTTFGQPSFTPTSSFMPPPSVAPPTMGHEMREDTGVQKELEVIAAKLDTIRAQLEMLNARVGNLEKAQQGSVPPSRRPWY